MSFCQFVLSCLFLPVYCLSVEVLGIGTQGIQDFFPCVCTGSAGAVWSREHLGMAAKILILQQVLSRF